MYAHPGCVDFSANLNPLGMPSGVREALCNSVDAFAQYPDPACFALTEALAAFEEVPREWVLACAGATDAFARVCAVVRPARGMVFAPCYSGYEQALEQAGARVWQNEVGFVKSGLDIFDKTAAELVFIANPNNPTGQCVERVTLVAFLEQAQDRGATVVLDECFIDLTSRERSNDLLRRFGNLIIVKAFTKSFALAGLRLGYLLCSDAVMIERLRAAGQPWAVSVPAQIAGVACVEADERERYIQRSKQLVAQERERLHAALLSFGLRVVPSDANFLLFEGPKGLYEAMLERGILIRPCDNYRGLSERWYRIAVRTPQENTLLMRAMEEVLR